MLTMQHKKAEKQAKEQMNIPVVSSRNSNATGSENEEAIVNTNYTLKATASNDNITVDAESQDKRRTPKSKKGGKKEWGFLSFDFQAVNWGKSIVTPLRELTVPEQENALIEDLLFVLTVRFNCKCVPC